MGRIVNMIVLIDPHLHKWPFFMEKKMEYEEFLKYKKRQDVPTGIIDVPELNENLFEFQRDIVRWALKRGRACIFSECGTGKTVMQLSWADQVADYNGARR
jgi:superfamily II DNA or RNA helicase